MLSSKDVTHQKRSRKVNSTVEIIETNNCPTDGNTSLKNYVNKGSFVKSLAVKLRSHRYQVFESPSDADTAIVKVAIDIAEIQKSTLLKFKNVMVYSDYTDVLCLLTSPLFPLV